MKTLIILLILVLIPIASPAEFSCPDGTSSACLDVGDTVCPVSAKCVGKDAVCFDGTACDSARGYICGSEYDGVLNDYERVVSQYNQLLAENVDLREDRLQQRNCVINAATLRDAIKCVRSKQ